MTRDQVMGFRSALQGLSPAELNELKKQVEEQISDIYWSDENFSNRESSDSYIYIVVYDDLTCHYDFLGKRAYEKYLKDERAVRIEAKTKHLFPDYKVLMQKGELDGQKAIRSRISESALQAV